jgi:NADH dehydrogenase FAD-containing subunit
VTLLGAKDVALESESEATKKQIMRLLKEKNINFIGNTKVKEIKSDRVVF